MSDELNKLLAKQFIQIIEKDPKIIQFKYYKEFQKFWKEKLTYYCKNDFIQFTPTQLGTDQFFDYNCPMYDKVFKFQFNVRYLLNSLQNNSVAVPIVLANNNGTLYYDSTIECKYNNCIGDELRLSSDYHDLEKVLIIPLPEVPIKYIVADGNHRVTSQIKENKKTLQAYCIHEYLAANSLFSAFQTCLYCLLFDIVCIETLVQEINHSEIRNALVAFSEISAISKLQEREQRDNT